MSSHAHDTESFRGSRFGPVLNRRLDHKETHNKTFEQTDSIEPVSMRSFN